MINLKNIKTDIKLPTDVITDINFYCRYRKQVNVDNYKNKAVVLSNHGGLDGLSAFYIQSYMNEDVPTRHPNIVALLFAVSHFVDTLIDAAVDDIDSGQLDQTQIIRCWNQREGTPEWMFTQLSERLQDRYLLTG